MRVLVVAEARRLADVLAEGLRDQGMAVDVARDGEQAAAKLDLVAYQVLVLDRHLSRLSGDALCRRLSGAADQPMVMMLSATDEPDDRVASLEAGADDYLAMPFHFPELVLRVRALARRQPGARPRTITVGGIELDTLRHVASRDGRPLRLTAKEFGVLEALMQSERAPLRTEQLLEQVWDEHADPFTNTVAVTVGRLRRKLGEPAAIETIPRVGYVLKDGVPPSIRDQELMSG